MTPAAQDAEATPAPPRLGPGVLFACFFLSGATGLIYQVVWLRMLGLVFGHTVYAITTVLAAFMAGLALGSLLFARLAARIRHLIRAYGWLEIGIGVYCAAIPALLGLAASLYLGIHRTLGLSYGAFTLVQFVLVFVLLLVPTTLMGGTLPILSQALVKKESGLGRAIGVLYAVNTFGAVAGVVLGGYVLLPALGNRATIGLAVAGNIAVGLLALAYARGRRAAVAAPRVGAEAVAPGETRLGPWLTVAALGVSGAVSMIYEVSWTRALALVIGSSTYAFTSMLVAFLVGIAGGSALYSWLGGTRRASPGLFAVIQAGIGLSAAGILLVFERMPELFLVALRWSDSPSFVQLTQFVVSAGSLLLPCLLIGATFPCAVAVAARGAARVGRDVGHLYAVNTLGAIAGTVLAGFVLIPALGVHASIKVGIVVNLLLAALILVAPPRPMEAWRWCGAGAALLVAAGVFFISPWDQRVMSSGPAVYGKKYILESSSGFRGALRAHTLLFYRDGPSATVSVSREGEAIFLRVNGKTDASTLVDMPTQVMLGHLALLVHPAPKDVLVIGLGSGITAGAVARHPVERLDIAEIEPAVVEASRFFAPVNGDVLKDPRVRTVIADARNFLLTTSARYDVIISEPSNPWIGGLASLFSVEFFELARQRLRPGGIMLQWLQAYSLFPEDLRMVVSTFRSVFPATTIWNTPGDFLLLGRAEPAPVDLDLVKARYQANGGIRRDLDGIGIRAWAGVLGFFMLDAADAARFSDGGGLNTDDRLSLEFSAPRALYLDTAAGNRQLMQGFKLAELPPVTPGSRGELGRAEVRYAIGLGYLGRNVLEDALLHFERAVQLDPGHTPSLVKASEVLLKLGRPTEALDRARRALAREPRNAQALFQAGMASEALNAPAEAVAFLERAVAVAPQNEEFRRAFWKALERAR